MAEISKQGLSVINGINFPDNTTGYITPEKLRTFNQDMIDSTVNQIVYDNTQTNLNAFTASITASVQELLNLSSSLSGGYVTEGELAAATSSLITSINTKLNSSSFNSYTTSTDIRLTNIESFTQSADIRLDNLETTSASVNISVANLNNFTNSVAPTGTGSLLLTSSFSGDKLTFTKGNGTTYENVGILSTASFNAYTQSTNTSISNLSIETTNLELFSSSTLTRLANIESTSGSWITESETASFARTNASNTFTAQQNIDTDKKIGFGTTPNNVYIKSGFNGLIYEGLELNNNALIASMRLDSSTSIVINSSGGNVSVTGLNGILLNNNTTISGSQHSITGSLGISSNLNVSGSLTASLAAGNLYVGNASGRTTAIPTSSFATAGTNIYSGSQTITGSVYGNVVSMSIASNTASMDLSLGNLFTLTLSATGTHLDATNVRPGQTISLLVTNGVAGTGTLALAPKFKQPVGFTYTASPSASAQDILTFVTFASTSSLYALNAKQFI